MATIDNLSIQVTTSADSAASALNRLASSASGLRGAAQGAAGGMQSAAQGAQDMGSSTAQAGEQTEKTRKSLHGFWNALKQSGSYLGGAFLGGMKGIVGALGSMASGLLRIAKFRIYRTIVKDLGQSFKDLYGWSKMFGSEYANSMDRINSSFVYLRNSIASAAAPLFNALAPVLDAIIDKIVMLLNWLNQLFSALSGASTYTVAKKVEQSWGSTFTNTSNNAKKTADDIKRTILGFDEINKLTKDKDSSSGGGGGSSPYTSGYQYMFEEKELAGGWKDFATAIENAMSDAFSRITMIVGGAELALGAILALSGANVPLGLGLMATGAVTLGSAIFANWEGISEEVKLAVAGVEAAVAGGLAVGAVLAFSGGHVGLGIGLMIAALSTGMGAATIAWNTIGDKMSEKVQAIATLVGGASFGIGAVLAFAGHPGIGIAMMIAGASVTAVSINWNFLKEKLEGPIGAVTTLISGASLALGILALLSGNIPIGLGLILAGTAGLATTVAANWDNLVNIGKTAIEKVKEGWETIKELVVNAVVSFVKKVGEWAEDVWDFLQNTGETITKKIEAAFEAGKSFAGDVWNFIKTGAQTIVKTVNAIFTEVGTWAGNVWDTVKAGAETIVKEVKAIFTEVGKWAGSVWDAVKAGAETIVKEVKAIFTEVGEWAGNVWTAVKNGAETIVKTVEAIFTEVGTWAGSVWNAVKAGAETIVKEVKAIFTEVGTWAGNVWDTVKAGAETIVKTVEAGMKKLDSWVDSIVDFILGPESSDKKANIAMAIENTALAIVNFLRDPAEAIKNVILSLGVKFAQGVEKFWNWITGQDGQSEVTVDAYGNFMIVPKAGTGLTDNGGGNFSLTNPVSGTTVLTPDTGKIDALAKTPIQFNATLGLSDNNQNPKVVFGTGTPLNFTGTLSRKMGGQGGDVNSPNTVFGVSDPLNFTGKLALKDADQKADAVFGVKTDLNFQGTLERKKGGKGGDINAPTAVFGTSDPLNFQAKLNLKDNDQKPSNVFNEKTDLSFKGTLGIKKTKYEPSKVFKDGSSFSYKGTLSKGWTGTPQQALGVDNLKTDLEVNFKKGSNDTIEITQSGGSGGGGGTWRIAIKELGGAFVNGIWKSIAQFANGGIFSGGFWKNIPQYAGGTTNAHGSMFLAGEAGPELVGHLGGRTEVLNQSQLAATMFSAVRAAMGGVKIAATFYNGDTSESSEADYEMMYRAMYDAFTDAMAGSNERDREKVQLMRQIAAKEFTAEVTAASVNRAQTRMNRRAGTTIVPVGT